MRSYLLIVVFLSVISCKDKIANRNIQTVKINGIEKTVKTDNNYKESAEKNVYSNTENFADSLKIALTGKYKIEITQSTNDTLTMVSFKLFEKENNKWKNIQNYSLQKDSDIPLLTEIKDFNNDGFNDSTIHYLAVGRGANDVRKLFVFSKKDNQFIEIKNSDDYSNLDYNKNLNCIDALDVYSGSTTTFLKLDKNILKEFARVNYLDGKVESYAVRNNKEIKLYSKPYEGSSDEIIRFSNYDPIEE